MTNVPDDYDSYWVTCPECGKKYHASEGYHCDPSAECAECGTREPIEEMEEAPCASETYFCCNCALEHDPSECPDCISDRVDMDGES